MKKTEKDGDLLTQMRVSFLCVQDNGIENFLRRRVHI